MNVAVIPARGGSKRLPGKNIRPFLGRPIIHYSIETALASGLFSRVIVSTDSEQIAQVARQGGAEVPFLRPPELADDFTSTEDVLLHALDQISNISSDIKSLCCIYATAPLIQVEDLKVGFEILESSRCTSVFSVTPFEYPILRSLKIGTEGELSMNWPEYEQSRSNDLPKAYHDAGAFYWMDVIKFKSLRRIFTADARPVILPRQRVQDIDHEEDWLIAEQLFRVFKKEPSP